MDVGRAGFGRSVTLAKPGALLAGDVYRLLEPAAVRRRVSQPWQLVEMGTVFQDGLQSPQGNSLCWGLLRGSRCARSRVLRRSGAGCVHLQITHAARPASALEVGHGSGVDLLEAVTVTFGCSELATLGGTSNGGAARPW